HAQPRADGEGARSRRGHFRDAEKAGAAERRGRFRRSARHPVMKPEQLLRKVFPPMLATLTDAPPADRRDWTFELKYDGFRAVVAIANGEIAMWSRNELDLIGRFPAVA